MLSGAATIARGLSVSKKYVHDDAVSDLVDGADRQNKNTLAKVFTSTLFNQHQDELDKIVRRAILRLQVSGVYHEVSYDIQRGFSLDCTASCVPEHALLSLSHVQLLWLSNVTPARTSPFQKHDFPIGKAGST